MVVMVRKVFLACLSGFVLILAFPRYDLEVFAFIALVPLLVAIEGEDPVRSSYLGLITGLVFYLGSISWVVNTMTSYGGLPYSVSFLILLALAFYLALYYAVFCFFLTRVGFPRGLPRILFASSLWVALEYLRTYLLTGFPWALLGYSQYKNIPLIQIASITGIYGLSFLLVLVNASIASIILMRERKKAWVTSLVPISAISLALVFSWWSGVSFPIGEGLTVSLLQGNVEQDIKWNPAYQKRTLETYRGLTLRASRERPSLIVWPETAAPFFLRTEDENKQKVFQIAREVNTYLLVGSPDRTGGSEERYFNSAFLVSPDGKIGTKYDKIHLVPFGEYVPMKRVLFFVNKMVEGIGDFSPGREYTVFSFPFGRFSATICFEIIFPDQVRRYILNGADFLVNITNDAWFGRSAAPYQHLSMAVLRAVENRVYLIRAANTGISAIINPDGRIIKASDIFVETELTGKIFLKKGETFYTRHGDVFALALSVISIIVLGIKWVPKRK